MSARSAASVTTQTPFTPDVARSPKAAEIADCVTSILEGRPLPEAWRAPAAPPISAPRTVEEGIARILRGHAPR